MEVGFFKSFLAVACCTEASEGGPGRISVANVGSPESERGCCTTGTPGSMYAGTLATDVIPVQIWCSERQPQARCKNRTLSAETGETENTGEVQHVSVATTAHHHPHLFFTNSRSLLSHRHCYCYTTCPLCSVRLAKQITKIVPIKVVIPE
jgi:hypothetical protein